MINSGRGVWFSEGVGGESKICGGMMCLKLQLKMRRLHRRNFNMTFESGVIP